jgi:hypothetical protein
MFHYTYDKLEPSFKESGLRKGTYLTPDGALRPFSATVDLSLPPNRELPSMKLRIDIAAMRRDGIHIPRPTHVSNVVVKDGEVRQMPGGGWEVRFEKGIPPEYIIGYETL